MVSSDGDAAGDAAGAPRVAGDVYLVRSFRIGPEGGLCPVTRHGAWTPGWNQAVCDRGREHAAPDPGCSCGLYAYSDAYYAGEQPTSRTCLAIVATHGEIMAGPRGVRMGRARVAAVWLAATVDEALRAKVAARYPDTAVFKEKAAMLAEFPLSELPGFRSPRTSRALRRVGYSALVGLVTVALGLGSLPAGLAAAHPGLLVAVMLATLACVLVTIGGAMLRARGGPAGPHMLIAGAYTGVWLMLSPALERPEAFGAVLHAALLASAAWYVHTWWRQGRPGRALHPAWLRAVSTVRRRRTR
jgi:hypothetical protein